jgi:hypothetical protein
MYFQHDAALWRDFPALVPGVLYAEGITADAAPDTDPYIATAKARLADGPESEFPEIQAWRRAFARMGLKPTQYRCAAESLLRRFRTQQPAAAAPTGRSVQRGLAGLRRPGRRPRRGPGRLAARGAVRVRRRGLPHVRRRGRAPRPRRGDLRRPGRAGARPPLDQPAERPVRGLARHQHRPDRGRGPAGWASHPELIETLAAGIRQTWTAPLPGPRRPHPPPGIYSGAKGRRRGDRPPRAARAASWSAGAAARPITGQPRPSRAVRRSPRQPGPRAGP